MSATVPLNGTSRFPATDEGSDTARVSNELTEAGTSRDIQTKKWRFHFNDAGAGHPLVFLHGSGPGATGWTYLRDLYVKPLRVLMGGVSLLLLIACANNMVIPSTATAQTVIPCSSASRWLWVPDRRAAT